jgi:hypothetical protein
MASIHSILQPITLTKVISRQMAAEKWILNFFGMQPGGPNEEYFGHGREGSYQVFNNTRQIAKGRAPGTAAAHSKRQAIGVVPIVYPRMHEEIPMMAEELHNLARIGDPRIRDEAGAEMIKRQTKFLAQRAGNWRAAQVAGMIRDALYVHESGDDWYFNFTSTSALFRLNFGMPAGNQTQLDMLGDGDIIDTSWDNPAADIPSHLGKIDAAFQELYGGQLRHVMVQSAVWQNVIKNDHIASQAGIADSPFTQFERVVGQREDGSPLNVSVGQLKARPGVMWWITDEGLDLGVPGSETFTKYIGDNSAAFLPDVNSGVFSMQLGSEPIAEYDGAPETVRVGFSAWSKKSSNPTATELFILDNALAINHIPNSTAYGTVIF